MRIARTPGLSSPTSLPLRSRCAFRMTVRGLVGYKVAARPTDESRGSNTMEGDRAGGDSSEKMFNASTVSL